MNLIRCSSDCIYQKDGCCTLDGSTKVTSAKNDCCYYSKVRPFLNLKRKNKNAKKT